MLKKVFSEWRVYEDEIEDALFVFQVNIVIKIIFTGSVEKQISRLFVFFSKQIVLPVEDTYGFISSVR